MVQKLTAAVQAGDAPDILIHTLGSSQLHFLDIIDEVDALEKDLEKVNGTTQFVRAYVCQNALGGHNIPVSKGAIDVLHAVGVLSDVEADREARPIASRGSAHVRE